MTDITAEIKGLLLTTGNKNSCLIEPLGFKSKQSLSNKFSRGTWTAEELIKVADALGCDLAFILPNGDKITLNK